jgi:hypothetical protein
MRKVRIGLGLAMGTISLAIAVARFYKLFKELRDEDQG